MSHVKEVESYLVQNLENIDLIVEQVVSFLPDSYFYLPEIREGEFVGLKKEMDYLRQKSNFSAYQGDKSVIRASKKAYERFEQKLQELADRKRKGLLEELLNESDEMKIACSLSLIMKFNLLKRMRTFY